MLKVAVIFAEDRISVEAFSGILRPQRPFAIIRRTAFFPCYGLFSWPLGINILSSGIIVSLVRPNIVFVNYIITKVPLQNRKIYNLYITNEADQEKGYLLTQFVELNHPLTLLFFRVLLFDFFFGFVCQNFGKKIQKCCHINHVTLNLTSRMPLPLEDPVVELRFEPPQED